MTGLELPDDLSRCVEFHGHLCPGLVTGYCAARLALDRLAAGRPADEELIAIVENDTCAVDAVQVLAGCTFGKGNLYFRDYGKMAFTFAVRSTGRSLRLCRNGVSAPDIESVPEDRRRMRQVEFMLSQPFERLFTIRENPLAELPERARIRESLLCDQCGEAVMSTRVTRAGSKTLCIPCGER